MTRQRRALIVEGGGMKAAYANGVLAAFERAGSERFDMVLGTSAGGALAAWFSAGQAEVAYQTWRYAQDPRILSYRRAFMRQGPVLDQEALFEIVYKAEVPLDVAALRKARWPVIVTVADVDSGECLYPDIRKGDTIEWLKATGRLPFGAGEPVVIDGRRYLDGGVWDPIPARHAVEEMGATEIVFIGNNPPGRKRPDPRVLAELAARRYPALRDGIVRHQEIKADALAYLEHPPDGVTARILRPQRPTGLGRFSRDLAQIDATIRQGELDGEAFLQTTL